MGWLWIIIIMLSISTIFFTIKSSDNVQEISRSEIEELIVKELLRSTEKTTELKSEIEILQWSLQSSSLLFRNIHLQFHGWSMCTILSIIYVILTGICMTIFGIVNTIFATSQSLGILIFLACFSFTFISPMRRIISRWIHLKECREYILNGITTKKSKHKMQTLIKV